MANRIWSQLMGRGIVDSPDNFGTTGQLPTHPELLDFLSRELIRSGWSAKSLIRRIVLSEAYSRSSDTDPAKGRSGLIPKIICTGAGTGASSPPKRSAIPSSRFRIPWTRKAVAPAFPMGSRASSAIPSSRKKRSVYVPVFRNRGYEMFGLFDFANPNFTVGKRSKSTIPTQALFLTNSPFIHKQSELAAKHFLEETGEKRNDAERIEALYREILGRPPLPDESTLSLQFIRGEGSAADE